MTKWKIVLWISQCLNNISSTIQLAAEWPGGCLFLCLSILMYCFSLEADHQTNVVFRNSLGHYNKHRMIFIFFFLTQKRHFCLCFHVRNAREGTGALLCCGPSSLACGITGERGTDVSWSRWPHTWCSTTAQSLSHCREAPCGHGADGLSCHAGQSERPSDLFLLKYFLLCNDWELRLQSTNTAYLAGQSGLCHHPVSPEGWAGSDLPAMGFYGTSEKYAGRLVCFTGSNIFLMN